MIDWLHQMAPWGLTFGQTGSVFAIAVALLIGLVIVRFVLRLGALLFRLGCIAVIVFVVGIISFMVLSNLVSTYGK